MNARIHHILDEALLLDQEERSALVLALLESLESTGAAGELTAAWKVEIDLRRLQLARGELRATPWAEAKARLLAL